MSPSELFRKLGAPLKNTRWSWGSVRDDGTVFLGVWQDETRKIHGRYHARIALDESSWDAPERLGWQERLEHIELIKNGAPCYMIMCRAKDPKAVPRTIKSFDREFLFKGGELRTIEGDTWLEWTRKDRVSDLA